jgi:hypothetical protein
MALARDKSPADFPAASVRIDQFLAQRLSSLDVNARAPALDAVIENNQSHGYRLNPDTVRIVAITELTASK